MSSFTTVLLAVAVAVVASFWAVSRVLIRRMRNANEQERDAMGSMFDHLHGVLDDEREASPGVLDAVRLLSLCSVVDGEPRDGLMTALESEWRAPTARDVSEIRIDEAEALSDAVECAVTAFSARHPRRWARYRAAMVEDPHLGARAVLLAGRNAQPSKEGQG